MKKVVFFLALMAAVIIGTSAFGQRSKIYSGDKNASEIEKSIEIFRGQIANYQVKVAEINSANKNLLRLFRCTKDSVYLERYSRQIKDNDSLIVEYNQKISYLEQQLNDFIVIANGKDRQDIRKLRGRAAEVAEAYMMISYADQAKVGNVKELNGLIINNWYYAVTAVVRGPGNFYREFNLKPNNGKACFPLPCPGNYTTTFMSLYSYDQSRSVTKTVGPNIIYYDDDGKEYAYKATLLKN